MIRIVSWNMSQQRNQSEAWEWLFSELEPDIVLAQECFEPEDLPEDYRAFWACAHPKRNNSWGTALVTRLSAKQIRIPELDRWFSGLRRVSSSKLLECGEKPDGWLSTVSIEVPQLGRILVASVHSPPEPFDPKRLVGVPLAGVKLTKSNELKLPEVLFHILKQYEGKGVLVGGSFGYSRAYDQPKERGNNEFFDRLQQYGFHNLHRRFHSKDEPTFFAEGEQSAQRDYFYADGVVASRSISCDVLEYETVEHLSDHTPLVLELDLEKALDATTVKALLSRYAKGERAFKDAALKSVDLSRARLEDIVLIEADLRCASLNEAVLCRSDLSGADLRGAEILNADFKGADLSKADLGDATLNGSDFSNANLRESELFRANLEKVILVRADLTGADLREANLRGANLTGAKLNKADLTGADLSGAMMCSASLVGADLRAAELCRADASDADFKGADLRGANLQYIKLSGANMVGTLMGE